MKMSDVIADFIGEMLSDGGGVAELQRKSLADRFSCVPSQINYVIETRFTPEHGYLVESQRGGGGFIRIIRLLDDKQRTLLEAARGIGGRLDHTLTNIQLLYDAALRGEEAVLLGGCNEARMLMPGAHRLPRHEGWKLSLLAYTPEVKGLTLRGVEYPLTDYTLVNHTSLGVSNEWTADFAEVSFTEGALLAIYAKDALT